MSEESDSVRFGERRLDIENAGVRGGGALRAAAPQKVIKDREIELKLACEPKWAEAVANSPVLAEGRQDEARDLTLTAIYYDTPGHDLLKSNTVLRVRTDGDRFVMTAKTNGAESGKALERSEREVGVQSPEPERSALPRILSGEAWSALRDDPLIPVFRTEVRRQVHVLDLSGSVVEVAVDQGAILAGERTEMLCEVELELVEGKVQALFELADKLVRQFPLRPTVRSKSARGFDLAAGASPPVSKAPKLEFDGEETLDDVVATICHASLRFLLENQPAAEDGRDPEGLHQYRIALRRLRALFALLRPLGSSPQLDELGDDAKWLMSALNDARDWDVFLGTVLPAVWENCGHLGGFDALEKAASGARSIAYRQVRASIADARNARFQIALGLWIERRGWRDAGSEVARELLDAPARAFAADTLSRLHRKVLRRGRRFERLSPEERHRLRIAVKKLRYAADFLLPLFEQRKRLKRFAKSLSHLQEQLGVFNDVAVAERLVGSIATTKMGVAGHKAAGIVLGWQSHRLIGLETSCIEAWSALRSHRRPVKA